MQEINITIIELNEADESTSFDIDFNPWLLHLNSNKKDKEVLETESWLNDKISMQPISFFLKYIQQWVDSKILN